jgi:hypothetical protein
VAAEGRAAEDRAVEEREPEHAPETQRLASVAAREGALFLLRAHEDGNLQLLVLGELRWQLVVLAALVREENVVHKHCRRNRRCRRGPPCRCHRCSWEAAAEVDTSQTYL